MTSTQTFFKDMEDGIEVNINSDIFKNNKNMTQYLDMNEPKFHKNVDKGGHIQYIPKSNFKYVQSIF